LDPALLVRELVLLVPEIPLKDQALPLCIANNSLAVASALRVVRGKELQAGKRALAKLTNGAAIAEYLNYFPMGCDWAQVDDANVAYRL
jgi:hypothetical protein